MSIKNVLPPDYKGFIEPENPVTSPQEFVDEIIKYYAKEKMDVKILEESMEPIILVNGKKYQCRLGEPRLWKNAKIPIRQFSGRFFGYKWIYIYLL